MMGCDALKKAVDDKEYSVRHHVSEMVSVWPDVACLRLLQEDLDNDENSANYIN